MKNTIIIALVCIAFTSCENSSENPENGYTNYFAGVFENTELEEVNYFSVDAIKGDLKLITRLENISFVHQGESTYDPANDYFIIRTNLGITIIDTKTGAVINSFEGLTQPEYNPVDGMIYGIYWNNELFKEFFAKADLVSGEVTTLGELPTIESVITGNSTFDTDRQNYCFASGQGVVVVDISNGDILNKFDGIEEIEYDQKTGALIGLSDDSPRKLLKADMQTGEISILGITNIDGVRQGVSAFDQEKGYYIIMTDDEIILIDTETLETINTFEGLTEIECLNQYEN